MIEIKISTAKEELALLASETRLRKPFRWHFYEGTSLVPQEAFKACKSQMEFIKRMKEEWRQIRVPDDWLQPIDRMGALNSVDALNPMDALPLMSVPNTLRFKSIMKCMETTSVSRLTQGEIKQQHAGSQPGPDFYLSTALKDTTECCLALVVDLISYNGQEKAAEAIIPSMFTSVPRCWLRTNPQFDLRVAEVIGGPIDNATTDFALVLISHDDPDDRYADRNSLLRVDLAHPALLVGVKGPARWKSTLIQYQSKTTQRETIEESTRDLSDAVQPSLNAHICNWHVVNSGLASSASWQALPEWMVVFGVIYDAESIQIVAHIPFLPDGAEAVEYLSIIVDRFPFTARAEDTSHRLRAALALLSVRKHAYHLSCQWMPGINKWYSRIVRCDVVRQEVYLPFEEPEKEKSRRELMLSLGLHDENGDEIRQLRDDEVLAVEPATSIDGPNPLITNAGSGDDGDDQLHALVDKVDKWKRAVDQTGD